MIVERCEGCGAGATHWPIGATWVTYCCGCYGCEGCEHCGPALCGSCSDDMGDAFDAWPSDAGELAAGDRVPCGRCGA